MLAREDDVDAHALHRQGWTISVRAPAPRRYGAPGKLSHTMPSWSASNWATSP